MTGWLPLIHPLELFAILAIAGTCLLYAFLLHLRVRTLGRQARKQREYFETRLAEVLEATEESNKEREEAARPSAVPAAAQPLNLNKRGQVLRMRRRGENPETIAAALSIPRNEVNLLLKVHQMSLEQVEKGTTQAAG
jgi:hypothetical protein